jgi:uncharacterized membrane protein
MSSFIFFQTYNCNSSSLIIRKDPEKTDSGFQKVVTSCHSQSKEVKPGRMRREKAVVARNFEGKFFPLSVRKWCMSKVIKDVSIRT